MERFRSVLMVGVFVGSIAGYMESSAAQAMLPSTPDLRSWADVPCDVVAERNRSACVTEHERLGIPAEQSIQSATQSGAQSMEMMRQAASVPESPEELEEARSSVDSMLGHILKDPLSAMQYRVSDPMPCAQVIPGAAALPALAPLCICYQVNAKNSYGGYTGAELSVAAVSRPAAGGFVALPFPKELFSVNTYVERTCDAANMRERDAALIHAAVK